MSTNWTDPLLKRLAQLHANPNKSFKDIALQLSQEFGIKLTKNACIGRARRLGLEQRPRSTPKQKPRKKRTRTTSQLVPRPVVATAWKVEPPTLPAASGRITIYQLSQGVCHFPFGDRPPYAYCGNTARRGMPWCPYHETVVYPRGRATPT
jgi:hypothetical protein